MRRTINIGYQARNQPSFARPGLEKLHGFQNARRIDLDNLLQAINLTALPALDRAGIKPPDPDEEVGYAHKMPGRKCSFGYPRDAIAKRNSILPVHCNSALFRLGLAQGKSFLLEDMDEMYYVYDLAVYTAPADRSRAIDRYAKSARFEARSDDGLMLDAMRRSQFAVLLIEQRRDTVGLIATDILRNSKVWLLDVGIESSMDDGELIATRLITPGPFSMTAGVMAPFEIEMLEPICMLLPQRIGNGKLSRVADDRRFAQAVYKVALADGVMDRVGYLDPPAD